ncbi:alpha/beta-hydrolase [Pseudovirgaria hyperparasitica]|uniref:Alpha/beta-hydrolase n=1 Tax=Pseudovirgaria hyperparasitica TaxID=470096 RepID=A0A6A6W666_9PEZI|nr:alpha/beta-hydrolase [Pseudovirgaria hyperparasitica]KAF2757450.1 alpha/beta-hydrolase [Pseudovirgaria hyperparasitica]
MRSIISATTFAGLAAAAIVNSSITVEPQVPHPQDAVPSGVQIPSKNGFEDASVYPSRGGKAVCVRGIIPVEAVSPMNVHFNYDVPANQSVLTQTFVSMVTPGSPFMQQIMGGTNSVSGTYNIYSELCLPAGNAQPKAVQFLTHGIGFNHLYWDYAPGYSYVDAAIDKGFATFNYDRLGTGLSTHPDAIQTTQAPLELAIAAQLVQKLRAGAIGTTQFSKVVAVGHSFGSIISQALSATAPHLLDAVVLTGFSTNTSGLAAFTLGLDLSIASGVAPYRFAQLSNGYIAAGTPAAFQTGFFTAPGFDARIVQESYSTAGDASAIGELFTQAAISKPAANFTGPVAIVNGDADLPFCFGNCSYPVDKAQAPLAMLYPASQHKGSYIAGTAGHGINLHYSALDAYRWIQDFLAQGGITAE